MNEPKRGPAYPPWDRLPENATADELLAWYQVALGVLLLNTTPDVHDEAARQADVLLARITAGGAPAPAPGTAR